MNSTQVADEVNLTGGFLLNLFFFLGPTPQSKVCLTSVIFLFLSTTLSSSSLLA